jgi:hypothetical protein
MMTPDQPRPRPGGSGPSGEGALSRRPPRLVGPLVGPGFAPGSPQPAIAMRDHSAIGESSGPTTRRGLTDPFELSVFGP